MTSFTLLLCPSRGYYFFFLLDFRGSRDKYYWHIISEPDITRTREKKKYTQQLSGGYIGKADASYILNDIYESTHKYFTTRSRYILQNKIFNTGTRAPR